MSPRAEGDLVFLYARRAAGAGNPDAAEAVARRLERARTAEGRLQALAVRADGAFARGDAAAFESALAGLLEVGGRPRVRLERDRLALEILAAAAVRLADGPDRSRALALGRALDRVRQAVALRRIPEVDRLRLAALNAARAELAKPAKGALPLALGEVAVPARRELPPLPVVGVEWPEPRSLLALPAGGAMRDWFDDEELAQGSTP